MGIAYVKMCVKCGKSVDWELVTEVAEHIFLQADSYGMESLTEDAQTVVEGKICEDCCEHVV